MSYTNIIHNVLLKKFHRCRSYIIDWQLPNNFGCIRNIGNLRNIYWELREHRVLEEHGWKDIDWQLPNKFSPGDVGGT